MGNIYGYDDYNQQNVEQYLPYLKLEHLAPLPRKIAETVGIENLYKISVATGGNRVYIPKKEHLFKEYFQQEIIREYKEGSTTFAKLAIKYGLCEKTVENFLGKENIERA